MIFVGLLTNKQKQAGYFIMQDEDFVWLFHRSNGTPTCIKNWLLKGLTIEEVREAAQKHNENIGVDKP